MKKLLMLSSILLVALTLVGCKPEEEEEVCTNNAANGTLYEFDKNQTEITEIKVWIDDEDYATALIDAFELLYPDIKVELDLIGAVETRQRLEIYSGSDYAADVVVFPHDHIGAALNSNLLYPFPASQRDDLIDRMVGSAIGTATSCYDPDNNAAVECDGVFESRLFGAPLSGESVALFYNKTLLQEIHDTDVPEATFEEMLISAAAYNQIDDPLTTDVDEAQLYFAGRPTDAYFMHFAATAHGYDLFGADHLDKTLVNFDSQEMIDALTWIQDELAPVSLYNAATLDANYQTMFEEGKLVYMINGPWAITSIIEAATNNSFEFGITKIPTIDGVQPITFSGVQIAAVYKGSDEPTAAFKFVEFMTSDAGLAIMYETTNKLPALKDVSTVEGVATDVYLSGISAQLAYSHPMPIIPEMGYFWSNASSMYEAAWNDTKTPAEAAEIAQTGFETQAELVD